MILSATVLDAVMTRLLWAPMLRFLESQAPRPTAFPPVMRLALERAWVRRLYNLFSAALLLAFWYYLGTASGAAWWTSAMRPAR